MTGDSLYLKVNEQKAYEDDLKKGIKLLKELPEESRDAFGEILKSGKPEAIEALTKVFIKREIDPAVLKRALDAFSRIAEFRKEQGGELSEPVKTVTELVKVKLSEQNKDN